MAMTLVFVFLSKSQFVRSPGWHAASSRTSPPKSVCRLQEDVNVPLVSLVRMSTSNHRLQSSSLLELPYRILNINHHKTGNYFFPSLWDVFRFLDIGEGPHFVRCT